MKSFVSCVVVAMALFVCGMSQIGGRSAGLAAPRIVYSCTVKNMFDHPVDVEVRYTHPFENRLVVDRATLAKGQEKFFDRREFQTLDKTTFAAVISDVVVKDVANTDNMAFIGKDDFKIYSPTANYKINVVAAENSLGFEVEHGPNL